LMAEVGVPDSKISVIPHPSAQPQEASSAGAELRSRFALGDARILLAFGFIHVDKGLDDLIRALIILRDARAECLANVRVVVAGDVRPRHGPFRALEARDRLYRKRLVRQIRRHSLRDLVVVTGYVPDGDVAGWFDTADAVVLPYRRAEHSGVEGLARAFGVPVLVSAVGGLAEQVTGQQWTFPPDAAEQLAEAVADFLTTTPAGQPRETAARGDADLDSVSGLTLDVYSAAMAARSVRASRIVQTPVRFFPALGGVEKYVLELSRQLAALGNDVTVICADEPPAASTSVDGMTTIRLPYIAKIANTNVTPRLFRTLMSQRCDLIHTHVPTPWSADISALVSLLKRKPLFVTYHNDLTGQRFGGILARVYNATLLHFVLWRAKVIIITQPKYLEYSGYLRPYRAKVAVIPPGVTAPLGPAARKDNQIFFMSVLDKHHEYKGLNVLLSAMAKLRGDCPGVRLLVGGRGDLIGTYERYAKDLGIIDSVEFLGELSDEALAEAYSSSSVFVLPSLNKLEGFGIVALEALSYGTPVVTTSVAGSSEFIMRRNAGLVVPPGDEAALTSALAAMLADRAEAKAMGQRGAEAVGHEFGWDGIARRIADLYGRQ
jgi:glycosyltransferase involved in cell wall biosynthesis